MTTVRRAYSSTVVAPGHIAACAILAAAVRKARARRLSFLQAFGIGVPFHWKMTRLTVRPGPALELILSDGECLRVSTPDPGTAALLITGPGNAAAGQAGTGDTGTGARDKGTGEQHA